MLLGWETPEAWGRRFIESARPDGGEHLHISPTPQGCRVPPYLPPGSRAGFGMQLATPVHARTQSIETGAGEETA